MDEMVMLIQNKKELIEKYKKHIEPKDYSIIQNCNWIVTVGAYTVSSDNGSVVLQNVDWPTQYSYKSVNEIKKIKFTNKFGEIVIPKVIDAMNWYKNQIKMLEEFIKLSEYLGDYNG